FDEPASPQVLPRKACWQCGCIVRDHQITATEEIDDSRSREMADVAAAIKHKELRLPRALDWQKGGGHRTTVSGINSGLRCMDESRLPGASASSRAAVSGRLSSDGPASGTAIACSGVSISPGSSDKTQIPSAVSSSLQILLK